MSHDLSAGTVKLDLDKLINVAAAAVNNARTILMQQIGECDPLNFPRNTPQEIYHANHHCQFYAQRVVEAAKDYADAWAAYHALVEAKARENVEVIK